MFNDLNNSNSASQPAVDDIFAETDKPSTGGAQLDIETHRVGLAVTGENLAPMETFEQTGEKKSYLKIIIIVVAVIVVLGGGYFTYSQFIKTAEPLSENPATSVKPATTTTPSATTTKPADTGFVTVVPGISSSTTMNPIGSATSSLSTSTEVIASSSIVESTVDSDLDGLTDVEEKIAGTNPNVIDTDNDGLSDYEEVKIYHTNPLNADTDGDGYLDGAEIKSGYNPNGPGKLTDIAPKI